MININDKYYDIISKDLIGGIGENEYYNGTIEWQFDFFDATLRTTLIIYREPLLDPADHSRSATRITDIVPVWWELLTYDQNQPVPNDFGWKDLKTFLQAKY